MKQIQKKEIVDLCTLPNHGLLANEWMGAGVLGGVSGRHESR